MASWYFALAAPEPPKAHRIKSTGDSGGTDDGEVAPAAAAASASSDDTDALLTLHEYLLQRDSRCRALEGLLEAAAGAPKGHPSPEDTLRIVVTGLVDPDSMTTVLSTLDILETGEWAWLSECCC